MYAIITNDRHADLEVEILPHRHKAIERAKALAKEYCRFPGDYEEQEFGDTGLCFSAQYSCESDCIEVYKIKKPPKEDE